VEKVGTLLIQLMIGISLVCGIEAIRRRFGPAHVAETVRSTRAPDPAFVTQANLDLYMRVMRATAERARNPGPEDLRTMAAFKRIRSAAFATKLTPEEKQIVRRALLLINALDEVVAEEKHVDADRCSSAKAAVEAVLPAPNTHPRDVRGVVTLDEWRALESGGAVLLPWAQEVRELQSVVWSNR